MRRYLVLPVVAACLLVLAPGTGALAGSSTFYTGKNSQGQKFLFSVDKTGGGLKFDPFFTTMIDRCPVTGDVITVEFSFQGFEFPIKNGKFNLSLNDISDRFDWNGTVTPTKASGHESFHLAAFDGKGGLQDCATGPVSWKARALVPAPAKTAPPAAAAAGAAYVIQVTRAANGSVRFSVSH
jgi:hypothetical protein